MDPEHFNCKPPPSRNAASSKGGTLQLAHVSPRADKRSRGACRDYNAEKLEWGWARAAPVSQKSGGDTSSSPKKARRKVRACTHLLRHPHTLACLCICVSACCTPVYPTWCMASAQQEWSCRCTRVCQMHVRTADLLLTGLLSGAGLGAGARAAGVHLHAVQAAADGAAVHALRPPLLQALPGEEV